MQNKSLHRNIIPVTAIAVAGTLISQVETATWGKGIRLYITVTGATTGGGTDALFLCGVVPGTALTSNPVIVPIVGFAVVNGLSVNGVYVADFYPGAWLPAAAGAVGGALLGAVGIYLPMNWAIEIRLGAGNVATIRVDGELLP
jgi:hypothetical protein